MVNAYSGYSNKIKYDISKLVAQRQELTTFNADQSTHLESENGQVLGIPNKVARNDDSRNKKKPMHEIVCNNASKKYKPSLQRQGMSQIVVGDDKEIIFNAKAARVHCQFCRYNHAMPYCSQWKFFNKCAAKYLTSTSTPTVDTGVCNRIMYGTPLSTGG